MVHPDLDLTARVTNIANDDIPLVTMSRPTDCCLAKEDATFTYDP